MIIILRFIAGKNQELDYKETTILNLETTTIHRCEHFLTALQAPEATC